MPASPEVVEYCRECDQEGEAGGAEVADREGLKSCRRSQVSFKELKVELEVEAR
jgi:hypothetical protein